jgi:hypothetical protein
LGGARNVRLILPRLNNMRLNQFDYASAQGCGRRFEPLVKTRTTWVMAASPSTARVLTVRSMTLLRERGSLPGRR